jgi:predicted esterase
LFVASGQEDDAVPPQLVQARVQALCKTGAIVKYKAYPGNHGTMMSSSVADQMQWIEDRFRGVEANSDCH